MSKQSVEIGELDQGVLRGAGTSWGAGIEICVGDSCRTVRAQGSDG